MRRASRFVVVMAVAVIGMAGAAGAAKNLRDQFWTLPGFRQLRIDRIALLPVTSYDNNFQNENAVETAVGQAFKSLSYRWISGTTTREVLRARTGSDSLLKSLRAGILSNARVD